MRFSPRMNAWGERADDGDRRNTILPDTQQPACDHSQKRLSKAPSSGDEFAASITLEAAAAGTLFLIVCCLFLTFFGAELVQIRLQEALDGICRKVSVWSVALSVANEYTDTDLLSIADTEAGSSGLSGIKKRALSVIRGESEVMEELEDFVVREGAALVWQELIRQWLIASVGREKLDRSFIRGGANGLMLLGSTLEERTLDLVLRYEIRSPLSFPLDLSFPVVQRSCRRLWIGTKSLVIEEEEEEEDEQLVLVTQYGTVYHTTAACRSLNLHPVKVDVTMIDTLRNENGAKYYPCEYCARRAVQEGTVIITTDGTRYHTKENCGAISRHVSRISLSEAQEKYRACKFCGKAEGGS